MNEFIIDFTYDGIHYTGLVTPNVSDGDLEYTVVVESGNQEIHLTIKADHCGDGKPDWCYKNEVGGTPFDAVDKAFLQEIGEAIEKNEIQSTQG